MIDSHLQPAIKLLLQPIARRLVRAGIGADQITLAAFGAGLVATVFLALNLPQAALAFILLNRVLDGLDGTVARLDGPTDRGAFLDIAADFLFYALVPLGFAIADPGQNALPAAVLIASFIGTGSSFLAFATIAAKRGQRAEDFPAKGIYYLGGLTEGLETIAFFALVCFWPGWFPQLALAFAALCAVTTAMRWRQGWVEFGTGTNEG